MTQYPSAQHILSRPTGMQWSNGNDVLRFSLPLRSPRREDISCASSYQSLIAVSPDGHYDWSIETLFVDTTPS